MTDEVTLDPAFDEMDSHMGSHQFPVSQSFDPIRHPFGRPAQNQGSSGGSLILPTRRRVTNRFPSIHNNKNPYRDFDAPAEFDLPANPPHSFIWTRIRQTFGNPMFAIPWQSGGGYNSSSRMVRVRKQRRGRITTTTPESGADDGD